MADLSHSMSHLSRGKAAMAWPKVYVIKSHCKYRPSGVAKGPQEKKSIVVRQDNTKDLEVTSFRAGQGPNLPLECAGCGQPRLAELILYCIVTSYRTELPGEGFQGNTSPSFAVTGSRAILQALFSTQSNHLGSTNTAPCLVSTLN